MMEEWIKYINNPALVILLSEVLLVMTLFTLFLWIKGVREKRRAMSSLKDLAHEVKQNNENYKSQIAELLKNESAKDPAVIEAGLKKLIDGQEQLIKEVMVAVRTRDHDAVSNLGQCINSMVLEAVNIGRVSGESGVEKLEQEKEELSDKLNDTSAQMNELMTEYKSMFPEEGEDEDVTEQASNSSEKQDESLEEEQDTLMDISDDLDKLDNATSEVVEEKSVNDEGTDLSEEGTDISEDERADTEVVNEEKQAGADEEKAA